MTHRPVTLEPHDHIDRHRIKVSYPTGSGDDAVAGLTTIDYMDFIRDGLSRRHVLEVADSDPQGRID